MSYCKRVLLSRDDFREQVFSRDKHKCVLCSDTAQDAHHILERRLWIDGGYYLNNGASVCGSCHLKCESTEISVESVLEAAKITKKILPEHLYKDQIYDKWGNPILSDGRRLKGELFYDESVQKVIKEYLHLFTSYVKYPRTYHLTWSENITEDDRVIPSTEIFRDKRVIVTEKMDGENTTLYNDYIHARSLDSQNHPSRNWVKQFWSSIRYDIPKDWRICGENLYAEHSIKYSDLDSYFYGFSVWNDKNYCLSWDQTQEWFKLMGILLVPIIFDDLYDEQKIKNYINPADKEGYVIRIADEFHYKDFKNSVAKYVRKNHVQTIKHWMHGQKMIVNGLKRFE